MLLRRLAKVLPVSVWAYRLMESPVPGYGGPALAWISRPSRSNCGSYRDQAMVE